jgi:hypothetical protein
MARGLEDRGLGRGVIECIGRRRFCGRGHDDVSEDEADELGGSKPE